VAGPVATSPDVARGTSSGSTPTGSASASSRSAANRDDRAEDRGAAARGVALPGGSWIDLGLALAIVAAVALVWAQRRRRYTRRPPSADLRLDDPDLAPMPPVITQLRRRLRHPAPGDTVPTTSAASRLPVAIAGEEPSVEADPIHGDRRADEIDDLNDLNDLNDPDDARDDIDVDQADEQEGGQPVSGDGRRPRPPVPALTHPLIEVWPPAGLGLIGPGATAAARGFLVAALAAGGVDDEPGARTRVVMPAVTANVLLGPAAATLPETPRLTVTAGLDAALDLLEAHTLHRTRLVYAHEVDDLAALRTADPYEEPLPPILLLADPTGRHQRRRIAALLAQGQRLDIHGILLAAWPDGTTVTVADDGATTPADGDAGRHSRHPADVGRLTVLDPTQTVDLIGTLAESHTGQPHPAAPADPDAPAPVPAADPLAPASTDSAPRPAPAIPDREPPTEPAPEDPREQGAAVGETPAPRPVQTSVPAGAPTNSEVLHQPDAADGDAAEPAPLRGRIGVTVLGRPAIIGADPHRPLRAKSLELLVYLAVHDGTASAETILDDLLPDAPASKALHRLHTYVSDLRAMLRATAGPGNYLTHTGQRYTLTTDTLDIDLWRLHAALRDADTADTRQERTAALRRAVTTYAGPLADGCDYEWVEPYREGARQQALDAALALADLLTDQPAEQLTVLEAALGHNPYAEPLYQAAMRAHATLGHLDAIRTLRRTLTRRLAEIDAEPTDASLTLADHLIADLQRPRAQSPLRQADRSGEGTAA
jgi:DNA-binding SARP family transcriptional activator